MESTYTITENEYVKANKLFTKPTSKSLYFYGVVLIISVIIITVIDSFNIRVIVLGMLIGGYIGQSFVRHIYAPWKTKKQFHVYRAAQEPVTISVLPEGINFKSQMGEVLIEWNRIINWRENNDLLLIYQSPELYHILPKRVGDIIIKIRSTLLERIGNAT